MFDRASLKLGLDKAVLQSMSGRESNVGGVCIFSFHLKCLCSYLHLILTSGSVSSNFDPYWTLNRYFHVRRHFRIDLYLVNACESCSVYIAPVLVNSKNIFKAELLCSALRIFVSWHSKTEFVNFSAFFSINSFSNFFMCQTTGIGFVLFYVIFFGIFFSPQDCCLILVTTIES